MYITGIMNRKVFKACVGTAMLGAVGSANAVMTLTQDPTLSGASSLFRATGSTNNGNQKAYLNSSGNSQVNGGNPGNGWWTNPSVQRSWQLSWNNVTGVVNFVVYSTNDYSGSAAMSMSATPVISPGNTLIGLNVAASVQNNSTAGTNPWSLTYSAVEFDGGAGFTAVNSANATYTVLGGGSPSYFNNYHRINGPLGSFTLRGKMQMNWGTSTITSERLRFDVYGLQGRAPVPEPFTMGLGIAAAGAFVRRRMKAKSA
jgi:hypothetical protein